MIFLVFPSAHRAAPFSLSSLPWLPCSPGCCRQHCPVPASLCPSSVGAGSMLLWSCPAPSAVVQTPVVTACHALSGAMGSGTLLACPVPVHAPTLLQGIVSCPDGQRGYYGSMICVVMKGAAHRLMIQRGCRSSSAGEGRQSLKLEQLCPN